ncbi:hypothetical protein Droror1_Dr00019102 [Drosera rotundifolia]
MNTAEDGCGAPRETVAPTAGVALEYSNDCVRCLRLPGAKDRASLPGVKESVSFPGVKDPTSLPGVTFFPAVLWRKYGSP